MNGFKLFINGAAVLVIIGLIFSLTGEKGQFLLWLAQYRHPIADYYFYYVTRLGEPPGFIACGLLLWLSSWKKMVTIPTLGGILVMASYGLKSFFEHERPKLYLERIGYEGPMAVLGYPVFTGHHGFPSGHSMAAWALFTLVAVMVKNTWVSIACLFFAFSVSVSRIYLMAHFLQDVVAGAMVGIALGYGVYYLYDQWTRVKPT